MEHHKGPVEVQGRQSGHHQHRRRDPRPRPEGRPPAGEAVEPQPLGLIQQKEARRSGGGHPQHGKIQEKEPPHIGEVAAARLRPGQLPGAEGGAEDAEVQHLVVGLPDHLLRPAGPLRQVERVDLDIVEGAAQDGHGDGEAEHQQGQHHRQQDGGRFGRTHGDHSFGMDRTMSTWEGR